MARNDAYPRAMPFRPAEANGHPVLAAAPLAGRQALLMAGVGALFLLAGLGIGLLFLGRSPAAAQPTAEEKKEKPAPANPTRRLTVDLNDSIQIVQREPAKGDKPAPIPPKETVPPAQPVPVPEAVVEALGGLTASHLYQTYLNIGLLADSVEGEVYEKEEARKLLDTVSGLMTAVEQQLDRVGKQSLKPDEQKAVEQARLITASLRTQTRELTGYWEKDDKEMVARFHQARQDSWAGIKALLNLQD